MDEKTLMSEEEIHNFGIEIVFGDIKEQGFEILKINKNIETIPQIVCKQNDELCLIIVRTKCYPGRGLLDPMVKEDILNHAKKMNANAYFASVGIANSDGENEADMSIPVKGAGFYVAYEGLEPIQIDT